MVLDVGEYRGPLVLLVDGADVSSLVRREGNRVVYEPSQPFAPGEHRIQLLPTDPAGPGRAEWNVTTGQAAKEGRSNELYSRSGLSASASQVFGDKVRGSQVSASASLNVDVGGRRGPAELEAKGSFAYANTAPADKIEPSTYLLSLTYGPASVAFGDVSFRGTPLVAPGLARRGALAAYSGGGALVQVAQVSSSPVTGWDTGLSTGERISAGSASYDLPLGTAAPLKVSVAFVVGKNPGASGAGVASAETAAGGKAAGVQGSGRVFDTGVNAEAAWSSYDPDTSRGAGGQRDTAATIQLDRAIAGVSLSANYLYAGPDFASVANPGATRDRQQFGLSAGTGFGASTLSATAGRSWDNVEHDDARPVVYNDTWGLTYALSPQAWPSLSLSYLRGRVKSSAEPDGTPQAENTSDTVSGALAYARGAWSANVSSSWSKLDDRQTGQSKTLSEQLAVNLQPWASVRLAPTVAFTRSDRQGTHQDTRLGTLTLSWKPIELVSLDGQGSWTQNDASDGSMDNEQRTASLRLGYAAQWATRLFLARQASLSVSFSYDRQIDHRDPSNDQSNASALLSLSVFAPFEGSYRF
ncbi:MAG: hypothetical protein HY900_08485 [Deltaproteobacteria bacterium]|nr:hypothetical protein [Deltaproteobacteria bacterium]